MPIVGRRMGSVGRTKFLEDISLCGAEEGCMVERKLRRSSLYAGLRNGGRRAHHSLLLVSSITLRSLATATAEHIHNLLQSLANITKPTYA